MQRINFKRIAKAFVPYGFLWLHEKLKLNYITVFGKPVKPLKSISAKSPRFIITLTSYGKRVREKAPIAIHSLLNQSVQPDKIVLYLAHGTKVPKKLKKLEQSGLEIRFCEDIRSYTKLLPALSEFPNDILITADDDIYYPLDWFKLLKETHLLNPDKICCHRAHEICLDENRNIIPYKQWRFSVKTIEYSKRLFPTGVGGVLYPPHSFNNEIFDKTKFQSITPTNDDIWFWAMAHYNKIEYALVKNCITDLIEIGITDYGLWEINVRENKNDEQISNIIKMYPDVYKSIL